ncbi:MAG: hypothetical protein CO128_01665, partial [Ignavibacteriales bacterium CG_4_9_14_3_um_filter_30_11]
MKGLFYLLLFSMVFLASCVKSYSPTDTPTPTPTITPITITTSWNGLTIVTSGPPNSSTLASGTTALFNLSKYVRVEVSWTAGFSPFPNSDSLVTFETRLYGNSSDGLPTTLFFKKVTKSVDSYSVTLQNYQLIGNNLYKFTIVAQPVVAPADTLSTT